MPAPQLRRIAVTVDGSIFGANALDFAIDIARRYGAALNLITVAPLPVYMGAAEPWIPAGVPELELKHYRELLDAGVKQAEAAGLSAVSGVCLEGHVADEIVAYLEQHPADLLVMGSRGLSTTKRLLLGSTSEAVLHHVRCPVLVVRGPPKPTIAS